MRLATIRTAEGTRAVRMAGDGEAVELDAPDVGTLLDRPGWRETAQVDGPRRSGLDFAPLVPRPEKIICVGLNYRAHIEEMGRRIPEYPTLFAKYPPALVGAYDDVVLPAASRMMDWEAELAVVVGAEVRHADRDAAVRAIAGYTVLNDVTARDWQNRTKQWLQGKTFERTTPLGPWLEVVDGEPEPYRLSCLVDGEEVQAASTGDLVFGPAELVSYISTILTLRPGDVIATGTPGGVGHARTPPRFLAGGAVLTTRIEGLGECRNTCRPEKTGTEKTGPDETGARKDGAP